MHTCYSGGDVWNIKVPFGIAVREIASTLIKGVGIQHSREENKKSQQEKKKKTNQTVRLRSKYTDISH